MARSTRFRPESTPIKREGPPDPRPTFERMLPVWIDQGERVVPGVLVAWQNWVTHGWHGRVAWHHDGGLAWAWVRASRVRPIEAGMAAPRPGFGD